MSKLTQVTHILDSKENIKNKLIECYKKGESIIQYQIHNPSELEHVQNLEVRWYEYNLTYLRKIFKEDEIPKKYSYQSGCPSLQINLSFSQSIEQCHIKIKRQLSYIESIIEQLELFEEENTTVLGGSSRPETSIFIVHGHDLKYKYQISNVLLKWKLNPIVLDEQPNRGQYIFDKFEKHASEAGCAVVILTADDQIYDSKDTSRLIWRSRQNVIMELGYFLSELGKEKVIALYEENVELPSDYSGILYISLKENWQLNLAQELNAIGILKDMNSLLT